MRKVKFNVGETNKKSKNIKGVPFVMTYHSLVNSLNILIKEYKFL